ncbi:MAG: flagellar biosynthetic protein FliR [Gemmatimonadales bacterium]
MMQLLAPGAWPSFVLISTRLTGLMLIAPFWSMASMPRSVRGAVVVVLSAMLVPLAPALSFPERVVTIPIPLLSELVIGMGMGLAAAIVSQALLLASEVVALQMGLSLGQLFTPQAETGGSGLSQLYGLLGLAIFVAVGGPTAFIEAVARSVVEVPPGTVISFERGGAVMMGVVGQLFGYAVQIAGPILLAVTITNIAIAIISRAVPQLNAMAMSFAVTLGVGLMMFGMSVGALASLTGRWLSGAPAVAEAVVREMAPAPGR